MLLKNRGKLDVEREYLIIANVIADLPAKAAARFEARNGKSEHLVLRLQVIVETDGIRSTRLQHGHAA